MSECSKCGQYMGPGGAGVQLAEAKERAEAAEARVKELEQDAARIASECACKSIRAQKAEWRAEAAEARVKELENHIVAAGEVYQKSLIEAANHVERANGRVAELRALVDAATAFTLGDTDIKRVAGPASRWWVISLRSPVDVVDTRDEAIALARELAAKEPPR